MAALDSNNFISRVNDNRELTVKKNLILFLHVAQNLNPTQYLIGLSLIDYGHKQELTKSEIFYTIMLIN